MKHYKFLLVVVSILYVTNTFAQEVEANNEKSSEKQGTEKVVSPQAIGDKIIIMDGSSTLLEIQNEGSTGSILLPNSGVIAPTPNSDNKLYNNDGNLFWGSAQLNGGGVSGIDDLTDAKYDATGLYVGNNAGGGSLNIGGSNTGVGEEALKSNTTGEHNIAYGFQALNTNTEGNRNLAIGYKALFSNIGENSNFNGSDNLGIGYLALTSNTTGYENTAIGNYALRSNVGGKYNTALGYSALRNATGLWNTGIGTRALLDNIEGQKNTGVGSNSLENIIFGDENTAIGYKASSTVTIAFNTTAIGNGATPTVDNSVVLGNSAVTSIGGYANWSNLSDARFKTNIAENVIGLDFILGLRPVTYNVDVNLLARHLNEDIEIDDNGNRNRMEPSSLTSSSRQKKRNMRNSGFIAQEVEELANNLGYDFSGVVKPENEQSMYLLRYAEFVVPIVKAMQEQQQHILNQDELISNLQTQIDELKRR